MNVERCMTRNAWTCSEGDSLAEAARIMWENDCGCVPVVDLEARLVGMITDRDVCMAAYTQGGGLSSISVGSAMAKQVYSCGPKDTVQHAQKKMVEHRIRRIPVVDEAGRLLGVLSVSDLTREAVTPDGKLHTTLASGVLRTFASICAPRTRGDVLLASQRAVRPSRKSKPATSSSSKSARRSRSRR